MESRNVCPFVSGLFHIEKIHSRCSVCQNFIPIYGWMLFHCVYMPHSVYLIINWWALGFFSPHFGSYDYYRWERWYTSICSSFCLQFLWMYIQTSYKKKLLQEGGPLPGPRNGLLSNSWKWIFWGYICADKARDFTSRLRKPKRTGLPRGSKSWVLWWWD